MKTLLSCLTQKDDNCSSHSFGAVTETRNMCKTWPDNTQSNSGDLHSVSSTVEVSAEDCQVPPSHAVKSMLCFLELDKAGVMGISSA